ncbi:hypothetical protein C5167_006064, partial [Papaver somniferum]
IKVTIGSIAYAVPCWDNPAGGFFGQSLLRLVQPNVLAGNVHIFLAGNVPIFLEVALLHHPLSLLPSTNLTMVLEICR